MKLYMISGLGANAKAFERLEFPDGIEPVFIDWIIPEKDEALDHYAKRMAEVIDESEKYYLAGLSFGGIMAQEINRFLTPEKTLLISTVKSREELPTYMRLTAKTSAHKALPVQFFTNDSVISYTFFRKLYDSRMPEFQEFFTMRDPYYLKWAVDKIVNWENNVEIKNLYHIHGDKDMVFPFKYIQNAQLIPGGTHLMVLQQPKKVSKALKNILTES